MGANGMKHIRYTSVLLRFLHKKEAELSLGDKAQWAVVDCDALTPIQGNGYDCGVFTVLNGYLLSWGVPLTAQTFTQDTLTMRCTRHRLAYLLGKAHNV